MLFHKMCVSYLIFIFIKEENETKTSSEYYSTHYNPQQQHYYYHPVQYNNESNNFHHMQTSNPYDPTQYYSFSSGYSHPQGSNVRSSDDESNQPELSSSVCTPIYHHHHYHHHPHYPPDEMLFNQKTPVEHQNSIYDYKLSPMSTIPSNQMFHQHQDYIPTSMEQTACSTSNSRDYLSVHVSYSNTFSWLAF